MLIYNELPTSFPWYDKLEKQQAYRDNAKISKPYPLISPKDALIPFEILITSSDVLQATKWEILDCEGTVLIDLTQNISLLNGRTVDSGTYIFYNGEPLTASFPTGSQDLNLSPGTYYSRMVFGTDVVNYSERFTVPTNSFRVNDPAPFINYLKIEYTNGCDIAPVLYAGNNGKLFKQVMYLDTFVHASEPEIEVSGEPDGDNREIEGYQRMIVSYRFSLAVPDFLKIAITSLQLHTSVTVTTAKGVRTGIIDAMTTTSSIEDNGAYSKIDVKLEQVVMVKHGCCDFLTLSGSNIHVNLFDPANIKVGFYIPGGINQSIVADPSLTMVLLPTTPGVRYYINNWTSSLSELGFYGIGSPNNPTALPVISSSAVSKISGMSGAYTVVAPSGAAYLGFNIKNSIEPNSVYESLQLWASNPGTVYMIRAQTLSTTSTKITAGIPQGTWGNIYGSTTMGGIYTLVGSSLKPSELLAGVTVEGNLSWWKVEALSYNNNYGFTPALQRTA